MKTLANTHLIFEPESCNVCDLPSAGEVVVWSRDVREPLKVRCCTIHRDATLSFLAGMVERWARSRRG